MNIVQDVEKRSFVYQNDSGEEIGRIDYKIGTKGRIFAVHTEVQPAFRKRGLAIDLLDALADWARESGQTIVPVCAFSKKRFEDHPEVYGDVETPPKDRP